MLHSSTKKSQLTTIRLRLDPRNWRYINHLIIIIIIISAASTRKSAKYSSLLSSHIFCPVAIETLGPLADEAQHFLTDIGRRATRCTADPREAAFLYQRISVTIQRFNAVCLANSLTISESPSQPFRTQTLHFANFQVPWNKVPLAKNNNNIYKTDCHSNTLRCIMNTFIFCLKTTQQTGDRLCRPYSRATMVNSHQHAILHLPAKFRSNRAIVGGVISMFFKMAAGSHIGFDLGNIRPPTKCNCRSQLDPQIWS